MTANNDNKQPWDPVEFVQQVYVSAVESVAEASGHAEPTKELEFDILTGFLHVGINRLNVLIGREALISSLEDVLELIKESEPH